MQRVCFSFEIYPGMEAEYKRRHDQIWPELVEAILDSGFRNHCLFRRGLHVIAYAECHPDKASAFASLASRKESRRWSEWMADVVVSLTDASGNRADFEEVWHLD